MATFLCFLILITSSFCIYSASNELGIEFTGPLIDSQSPHYHGSYELTNRDFDINYITNNSSVDLYNTNPESFLYKLNADDVVYKIFEFLDDNLFYLTKVAFTSKRLLRLLYNHINRRFFHFNPKIFWLLPPQTRLTFALKFLHKFEKMFPGLRGNVNLTLDELTVLMFLTLHCENVYFISPSYFKLINQINPNFRTTKDTTNQGLPYYSGDIWCSILITDAVKYDAFYAIESLCKIYPPIEINERVVRQLAIKLGKLEKIFGETIRKPFELLLNRVIRNDQSALKTLLTLSIDHGAISTFATFLPLWTGNLDQLGDGDSHVICKIANDRVSCPEILSRPELTNIQLASALLNCKNVGNSDFAIELLSRFPSNVFSDKFDVDHLNIIKQIVIDPVINQPLNIPHNLHLTIALLLASFHFNHPNSLSIFSHLIRGNNGRRISKQVLEELKNMRTKIYYNIAKRQNRSNISACALM